MKKDIDIQVEQILKEFNYDLNNGGYVNVVELINSLGFVIGETDKLAPDEDGFISVSEDRLRAVIGVNADRTFEEKRFIAAHELGHYFLTFSKDKSNDKKIMHRDRKKGRNAEENEIDFFAACLLMPYEAFKNHYNFLKSQGLPEVLVIRHLQRLYRAPMESIKRRIGEVTRENA